MNSKAFTLIELLIVVAIIAILAAIAVPNFLEAQTRSKVSRVKSDMRSLATALEAYAVDHNAYPTHHYTTYSYLQFTVNHTFIGGSVIGFGASPLFTGDYQITTPIAYITSMPEDVFYVFESGNPPETRSFLYINWRYGNEQTNDTFGEDVYEVYGEWRLTSGGPDRSRAAASGDFFNIVYDPSNGTISLGQIHRTSLSPDGIPQSPELSTSF